MQSNFSQYSPQGLFSPQGAGWPQQMSPGLFGPPGANSGYAPFGQEFGQGNPFAQNPFGQQAQPGPHHTQHLIGLLGQISQQLAIHNAMTQQVGIALHQLVQQLAVQSWSGGGAGGGQYFGQNPFAGAQAGYGGFNPQAAQAWGANRPQTIQ